MQFKINFLWVTILCIFGSSLAKQAVNSSYNILSKSSKFLQGSPLRSMSCFDYYIPIINGIAEQFEQSYRKCLEEAKTKYAAAEAAITEQKKDLSNRSQATCELTNKCISEKSSSNAFECYATAGSTNAKSLYKISSDASIHLSDLREAYRLIDREQQTCISRAERKYNEDSDKAFNDLNKCILGQLPIAPGVSSKGVSIHTKVL